jgi:hypothetical protein
MRLPVGEKSVGRRMREIAEGSLALLALVMIVGF